MIRRACFIKLIALGYRTDTAEHGYRTSRLRNFCAINSPTFKPAILQPLAITVPGVPSAIRGDEKLPNRLLLK